MRISINKTIISSFAALTIGAALIGSSGAALADGASHMSETASSIGSMNHINPLAPSNDGAVGSVETSGPFVSMGQEGINCHLLTNYKRPTC